MKSVLLLLTACTLGIINGFKSVDWYDILSADLACCSTRTNAADCANEGARSCVWVAATDPIAIDKGWQCVGKVYKECVEADEPCCSPKCRENGPDAPGPKAPSGETPEPILCFLKVTAAPVTPAPVTQAPVTPQPTAVTPAPVTPAPTQEQCELGVNYNFEGKPCVISGDPHTTMVNGDRHDYQGQPAKEYNGALNEQFYYMHRCNGYDTVDMPFNMMARHYHWGSRSVSGVDYLTIELYDDNGDEYYLFTSSSIAAFVQNGDGVSTLYDNNVNNAITMTQLVSGGYTDIGQTSVYFDQIDSKTISLKLTFPDQCTVELYMKGQTNYVNNRWRMHYVQIKQSECYKCFSCGLCGNFRDYNTGTHTQKMEGCDGDYINYRPGWNAASTPEAYDFNAWTWEKKFVKNNCDEVYDNTDNNGAGFVYTDPCDAAIKSQVEAACLTAYNAKQTCCAGLGDVCDNKLADCKIDACADANGDTTAIDDAVNAAFTNPVELACQVGGDDFNNDNTPQATVEGVTCRTVQGAGAIYPVISSVGCNSDEILASCNTKGTHPHQIYGNWVENDQCKSTGGTTTYSMARCCQFPSGTTVVTVKSAGDGDAEIECPAGDTLTGCFVNVNQNFQNYHLRIGAAGVDPLGLGFTDTNGITALALQPTDNTCTAGGFEFNTGTNYLEAISQCVSLPNGYELNCYSKWKYQASGGSQNWMTCDAGYFMTSCTVRANGKFVPDYWYVNGNGQCATQQDSHNEQWAQSVCCQLIKPTVNTLKTVKTLNVVNSNNNKHAQISPSSSFILTSYLSSSSTSYGIISLVVIIICFIVYRYVGKCNNNKKQDEYTPLINNAYDEECHI